VSTIWVQPPTTTSRYVVFDGETVVYDGPPSDDAKKAWDAAENPSAIAYSTMTYALPLTLADATERPRVQTRWQRATRALGNIVFPRG